MANPPTSPSNLANIKDRLQNVATELVSIAKSPPMADGIDFPSFRDDVIRRFDTLTKSLEILETLANSLAALRTEMTQRFDELKLHIMAVEHNSIARLANQTVTRSMDRLSPLRGSNNAEIKDFPTSFSTIKNMTSAELDRLLLALNLTEMGSPEEKKIRLITHIKGWHLV